MRSPGSMGDVSVPAWFSRSLAFNRSGLRPVAGIRAGLGVVVPLAVGSAVGHPAEGAQAAAGALPVGVAAMTGAFGPPTALMLATTAGMTMSTFVGSLVAGHPAATVPTLAVWGFAAGLMVALGQAATIVGVQAVVAFIVFGRYPGGVAISGAHAGWVLAGALVQPPYGHVGPPVTSSPTYAIELAPRCRQEEATTAPSATRHPGADIKRTDQRHWELHLGADAP